MRKILIGLAILGVGTVIVLGARKGLQEHAGAGAPVAESVAAPTVTGSQTGSAPVAEAAPGAEAASAAEAAPAGSVDATKHPPVDGAQRTDRGPMYPSRAPEPLPATASQASPPATGSAQQPAPAQPAQDSEIAAVLRRAARVYAGMQSLQADFSQRSTNPIIRTTVSSAGTLYQRSPDRFLMRFSDPAGDLIVSDGSYFWVYYPSVDRKQVLRLPANRGAGGVDLQAQFVGDPLERFNVTSEGREEIAGRSAYVLLLEPREPLGYRALKVWIDAADHLVRRFEVTEENGIVRHFELSNLKLNQKLGDDLFHFTIPDGAQVVDRG
jgi:chaperone LolA